MRVQRSLLVDSRARATGSSQDFVVRLNEPIFNVVRTDLRQLIISEGIYNVFERNNEFVLKVQKNTGTVAVPVFGAVQTVGGYVSVGYYTLKQFQFAVEDSINAALGEIDPTYTVTCSVNGSKKLEIYTSDASFRIYLDFPNTFSAATFGFVDPVTKQKVVVTTTPGMDDAYGKYFMLTSPFAVGLETIEYLAIQSGELGNRVATTSGIAAYDVIPVADRTRPLVYERYANKANDDVYSRKSHTLYQIDVRIIKPSGEVVDLRGNEVALVLEVITEE